MRGFLFFLFLSFLLIKGHNHLYAGQHTASGYSFARYFEKFSKAGFAPGTANSVLSTNHKFEKTGDFVILENADEDEDFSFARKYLLAQCILAFAYGSVFLLLGQYFKNPLPFCWHLSYTSSFKYILERVLRI